MGELVDVRVTDGVATIRLDRPPMNAISVQVQAELCDAAAAITSTPEIRAAVVYGGEKVFAAGADVKEMADKHYQEMVLVSKAMHTSFTAVATIPKPVVAAITGYALGGGLELALCADFRVCGESAKFGQPEILLGIIPGAGGTQRLPRLIGPARAKDLVYTGRFVDAGDWISMPASRWNGCISRRCSAPRTRSKECAASSKTARARPVSSVGSAGGSVGGSAHVHNKRREPAT